MSKDYIGKKKKTGGMGFFIAFCAFAFVLTFVISYVANSGKNDDDKNTLIQEHKEKTVSGELDEIFLEEKEPEKEEKSSKEEATTPKIILKPEKEENESKPRVYIEEEVSLVPEEMEEDISVSAKPEETIVPIVNGGIIKGFDGKPEYSEYYEDWRVHGGVDISGEEGTWVRVIARGAVIESYADPVWGGVLKVDHGSFVSVYMGLMTDNLHPLGTALEKGDTAGKLQGKIPGESSEIHLHFEIIEEGNCVDPLKYLG